MKYSPQTNGWLSINYSIYHQEQHQHHNNYLQSTSFNKFRNPINLIVNLLTSKHFRQENYNTTGSCDWNHTMLSVPVKIATNYFWKRNNDCILVRIIPTVHEYSILSKLSKLSSRVILINHIRVNSSPTVLVK